MFDVDIEQRDNGTGVEEVYVIKYWFDREFVNPYNNLTYRFNRESEEWEVA